jgi:hypothetical protein
MVSANSNCCDIAEAMPVSKANATTVKRALEGKPRRVPA